MVAVVRLFGDFAGLVEGGVVEEFDEEFDVLG